QAHLRHAVVLDQGRGELAAEAKGQLGRERLGVGEAAYSVGAEEAAHGRTSARRVSSITRTREGLTRSTVTPVGAEIWSGTRRTTTSPGRAPARLTCARTCSGPTRARTARRPWSCTSTLSGRAPTTSRACGVEARHM